MRGLSLQSNSYIQLNKPLLFILVDRMIMSLSSIPIMVLLVSSVFFLRSSIHYFSSFRFGCFPSWWYGKSHLFLFMFFLSIFVVHSSMPKIYSPQSTKCMLRKNINTFVTLSLIAKSFLNLALITDDYLHRIM